MLQWILDNREWLFSGAAISVLIGIASALFYAIKMFIDSRIEKKISTTKKHQHPSGSTNINVHENAKLDNSKIAGRDINENKIGTLIDKGVKEIENLVDNSQNYIQQNNSNTLSYEYSVVLVNFRDDLNRIIHEHAEMEWEFTGITSLFTFRPDLRRDWFAHWSAYTGVAILFRKRLNREKAILSFYEEQNRRKERSKPMQHNAQEEEQIASNPDDSKSNAKAEANPIASENMASKSTTGGLFKDTLQEITSLLESGVSASIKAQIAANIEHSSSEYIPKSAKLQFLDIALKSANENGLNVEITKKILKLRTFVEQGS